MNEDLARFLKVRLVEEADLARRCDVSVDAANSPLAVVRPPRWRTEKLPTDGQMISPRMFWTHDAEWIR